MVSLSEELAVIQFAQGVLSYDELLAFLATAEETNLQKRLLELSSLLMHVNPQQADVDKAIADSSLSTDYTPLVNFNRRLSTTIRLNFINNEPEKDVKFLLHLFKTTYQREYTSGAVSPGTWPYQDLSDQDVVNTLLRKQQELVEQLYNDRGFHSEFASLAKLWYDERNEVLARHQEPDTPTYDYHKFASYDEMIDNSLMVYANRHSRNISLLLKSLVKALKKKYGLDDRQVYRVIWAIVDRHMRERYNTSLTN